MPREKSHEIPSVRILDRRLKMDDFQTILNRCSSFVKSSSDMPIVGNSNPAIGSNYGYPVHIAGGDCVSDRRVTADYAVVSKLHHGQTDAGKILVNEVPDIGQIRQSPRSSHAIAGCTWS
jgi:hypothetical protein